MRIENPRQIDGYNQQTLLNRAKEAWPNTVVVDRGNNLTPHDLNVCVALCPLYAPGSLNESKLISPPMQIGDSRVAQKMDAYLSTFDAINGYLSKVGGSMSLTVVFANKAVLFEGKPDQEEVRNLDHHKGLYKSAMEEFSTRTGVKMDFYDYDDLGVEVSRFVDPNNPVPDFAKQGVEEGMGSESKVIAYLGNYLEGVIPFELTDNKKTRKVIKNLKKAGRLEDNNVFWLIAGYLAFDHRIPGLVGKNAIYVVSERFDPLFRVSKFTPELDSVTRIELKA